MDEPFYQRPSRKTGELQRLPFANGYSELRVYSKQRILAQKIFELSKGFPRSEQYSLTDQIRRSSRSIGAQIAEAWAKRDYPKHFVSKLSDADGENQETQHWIETARSCQYWNHEQASELLSLCAEIGRMLHSMKDRADSFCPSATRVSETEDSDYIQDSTTDSEH